MAAIQGQGLRPPARASRHNQPSTAAAAPGCPSTVRCAADDRWALEQRCRDITRPPCRPCRARGTTPRQAQTVHRFVDVRALHWPTNRCRPTRSGRWCCLVQSLPSKASDLNCHGPGVTIQCQCQCQRLISPSKVSTIAEPPPATLFNHFQQSLSFGLPPAHAGGGQPPRRHSHRSACRTWPQWDERRGFAAGPGS